MDRKHSSIGTAAYVASTLIVAFALGAFAAWAQSELEPADREVLYLVGAPWTAPKPTTPAAEQGRAQAMTDAGARGSLRPIHAKRAGRNDQRVLAPVLTIRANKEEP
jgi:hypothetical protein